MDFDNIIENERINKDNEETKVCFECDDCGCEIYEGEEYYREDGDIICEDCFDERQRNYKYECHCIAGKENTNGC